MYSFNVRILLLQDLLNSSLTDIWAHVAADLIHEPICFEAEYFTRSACDDAVIQERDVQIFACGGELLRHGNQCMWRAVITVVTTALPQESKMNETITYSLWFQIIMYKVRKTGKMMWKNSGFVSGVAHQIRGFVSLWAVLSPYLTHKPGIGVTSGDVHGHLKGKRESLEFQCL